MNLQWLKSYMPRSLYGRAALILLLPVVTLQLVITVVFVQRHFEGVTEQMSRSVAYDLAYLLSSVDNADDKSEAIEAIEAIAPPLALDARFVQEVGDPTRRWYDFSGLVVRRVLEENLSRNLILDLPDDSVVHLWTQTAYGPIEVSFDRKRVSASNPHQLLVWMAFLGLLMTVIAYIYLRNQLRPIKRLAAAATEYGLGKVVPYSPRGATEVRTAGQSFVTMRARLERQSQSRTLMLSGISHDLRTPLTRLKLGLNLLDPEEVEPLLRDVEDMEHLLDAFLDYAKGISEDEVEEIDVQAFLRDIVDTASRNGERVFLIATEGASQLARVQPFALRRAVENLIVNGLRYGERAQVSYDLSPRFLKIRVEDDGPGIPEEKRAEAMKAFTRLDPARNQNRGTGVGLGLAIVTNVARSHGGSLRLDQSQTLGGLLVELIIPQ